MDEPLTISKEAPSNKSMDYNLLRDEGIKYIQSIAGKLWTDYNVHDPGITILEVLCYALTDLGYRASYDIKDLITPPPQLTDGSDSHDFFTAAEILPNAPVTANDYRKLMMDVVVESDDPDCSAVGVKNAWIEKASGPEIYVYVDSENSKLVYEPVTAGDQPLNPKILHSILLEFDSCDTYGDLNENTLVRDFTLTDHNPDPELNGLTIRVSVEFPRWDSPEIDWESDEEMANAIHDVELTFQNLSGQYDITYDLNASNDVLLSGTKTSPSGPVPINGLSQITQDLNLFIYESESGMIQFYRDKISKIAEITHAVKKRLNANRNLCEDFIEFNALRIEEILVCADIELKADTDVDLAQAQIYHSIAGFLSPTVIFYTLKEMATRCFEEHRYPITSIDSSTRTFTISGTPDTLPEEGDIITVDGSDSNSGTYTVKKSSVGSEDTETVDVTVQSTISTELISGDETLILGDPLNDPCTPVESIFEGPLLNHGFIDNAELELADRRKVIRVSDLIQLIMDIDGVLAVKNIQLANDPQDNEDGAIESKNVRWCLELAFDENYVPRLNTDRSRLTFYKDQLPFKASRTTVDTLLEDLEAAERPQKLPHAGPFDLKPPKGEFKDAGAYTSIQNDFPLVYGIGEEGVPNRDEQTGSGSNLPTAIDAKQLKGYLMHFDQFLANYLAQLTHVRDLFSMNPKRDAFGQFEIGRTYFTQPLNDIVPHADSLYVDLPGHAADLNEIAESKALFYDRRNRFLDHLIARFAEQFTDYALLVNRISGVKAPEELIEDKLAFLNSYPEISSRRGSAIDYGAFCKLWHIDNASGLEKRASMLTGINTPLASSLHFSPAFVISGSAPDFTFSVENELAETLIVSKKTYSTETEVKEALEQLVVTGAQKHSFQIFEKTAGNFAFQLVCEDDVLAISETSDFTSGDPGGDADQAVDEVIQILRDEFFNNPESNRKNLASPLRNYFDVSITLNMTTDPPEYTIGYSLYDTPFTFSGIDPLLTGLQTIGGPDRESAMIVSVDTSGSIFEVSGQITEDLVAGDTIHFLNSVDNDDVYTISSFSTDGSTTEITVDEVISSDTAPLGSIRYNIITDEELRQIAESSIDDVLWAVVSNGSRRSGYSFNPPFAPFTSPYHFQIKDMRGNVLGASVASGFNDDVANQIDQISQKQLTVISNDSGTDTEGDLYTFTSVNSDGPFIHIECGEAPDPIPISGWTLRITDSFSISSIDKENRIFSVEDDLTDRIAAGESITISDHPSNNGTYTIHSVTFDGSHTDITVKEFIPSEELEDPGIAGLSYSKDFEVFKTAGSTITIRGGSDEEAVDKMIHFIKRTFFDHEGLHLVEHLLLRPKTDELLFVNVTQEMLTGGLSDNGELTFSQQYNLVEADSSTKMLSVEGDIASDISSGDSLTVLAPGLRRVSFTVNSASYSDPVSKIVVNELLMADIAEESSAGFLRFNRKIIIYSVDPSHLTITINGNFAEKMKPDTILNASGSTDGANDGRYTVRSAADIGLKTQITIQKKEILVRDRLLAINLDEKCECVLEDPYTCMAHVVLPYWPDRFITTEFRTFFEKILRREAPAHLFLNICWVSYQHMADFEYAWKTWLLENAALTTNKVALSTALEELIESIEQLRNVYPQGTLHDCDEDENLENSIILNHSALGEI